jgi:hypothetical protein
VPRIAQRRDNPFAHLGGGFASKRQREDLTRIDAGLQQVDVAVDQDPRLSLFPADASSATLNRGSTARSRPARSRASIRDSTVSGSGSCSKGRR